MQNTITMEGSPTITETVVKAADYWKEIGIGGFVTIFATFLAYLRYAHKKGRRVFKTASNLYVWIERAANAPAILDEIRQSLVLDGGLSLKEWASQVDNGLETLRQAWVYERSRRHAFAEQLTDALFEMDKQGHLDYANPAFLKLVECRLDQVLGYGWYNIIALPDQEAVIDSFAQGLQTGSDFRTKFRLSLDGGDKWVRFIATSLKDGVTGVVVGYAGKLHEVPDPRIHQTD